MKIDIKSKKKYLILGVVSLLLLLFGMSYAYYIARVEGEGKDMFVSVKEIKVVFTDTAEIEETAIRPDWSASKTFTLKNESTVNYTYNVAIEDLVNTFVTEGFLQYKITSDNGGYSMSDWEDIPKSDEPIDKILAYWITIEPGVTQTYTVEFRYPNSETVDQSDDMFKVFTGKIAILAGNKIALYNKILQDNPTRLTRTDFSSVFTETNTGTLYTQSGNFTEDVTGDGVGETVYYYAGDAQNNWVKFGKAVDSTCTYQGNSITYGDLLTGKLKEFALTENQCTGSKICKVTAASGNLSIINKPVMYATGVNEAYCSDAVLSGFFGSGHTYEIIDAQATYTEEIKDIYWRIMRTNEDGGVRLLYVGFSPDTNRNVISTSVYNGNFNDPYHDSDIGYMYGSDGSLDNHRTNANSSIIKTELDAWYNSELNTRTDGTYTYDSYISKTAIYCNDRSTNAWNVGSGFTYFAAAIRNNINKQPSYKCGNDETGTLYSTASLADKFSVSTTSGGNGALTYPIALATADELVYAGGGDSSSSEPYTWFLKNSNNELFSYHWWTMSPMSINTITNGPAPYMLYVSSASAYAQYPSNSGVYNAVRPVISLKSCASTFTGDGSSTSPYELKMDETCAQAEN